MKKLIYLVGIAALIFVFSCADFKVKRGVQDNIFYSSCNPKINIKINSNFTYSGSKSGVNYGPDFYGDSLHEGRSESEVYNFTRADKKRFVVIRVTKLTTSGWAFVNVLSRLKNTLESGTKEINGKKYQYAVFVPSSPSDNCLLIKSLSRILSADDNHKIDVVYIEPIGNEYSCSDWKNLKAITVYQKTV